jgi:hypothetical protein
VSRCSEQVVRPFRAEAIAGGKGTVEVPQIRSPLRSGRLVDDRVRLGKIYGAPHCCGIEPIRDECFGTELPDKSNPLLGARGAHNVMSGGNQPWKKVSAYGAGSAGYEDPHDCCSTRR